MASKYLLIVNGSQRPELRLETNNETEMLNWLASFRMELAAPRIELHTQGVPGYEWWDKQNYHSEG